MMDNSLTELRERVEEVLATRINQQAESRKDIDQDAIASIAQHWSALQAIDYILSK